MMLENNQAAQSFPSVMLLFYQLKEAASIIIYHKCPSIWQQQVVHKNSNCDLENATESQNGWGWRASLEIAQSNAPAQRKVN